MSAGESKQMSDAEFETAYLNFSDYFEFLKDVYNRSFTSNRTKWQASLRGGGRYLPWGDFSKSKLLLQFAMDHKKAYEMAQGQLRGWSDAKEAGLTKREWLLEEKKKKQNIRKLKEIFDNDLRRYHLSLDFDSYEYGKTYDFIWFESKIKSDISKLQGSFSDWIRYKINGDNVIITVNNKSFERPRVAALRFIWRMVGALTVSVSENTKDRDLEQEYKDAEERGEFKRIWENMLKRRRERNINKSKLRF